MKKITVFFFVLVSMFSSCNMDRVNREYEDLKKNTLDLNLYQTIFSFEIEHPEHFESKLDLAKLNLFAGNYEKAWEYLRRAEGIYKNSKKTKISKSELSSMYGTFASLYLISNNLTEAEKYINEACKIHKFGAYYGYLKGQIDFALQKKDSAWEMFEKTYKRFPSEISISELRTYMYLAAEKKEYKKALKLLELYFEKGTYFPGLGLFASGVYEKNDDYEKSVFMAFLDYEYQSCFSNQDDSKFVTNLTNAISTSENEGNQKGVVALKAVQSLYTGDTFPIIETDFFAYKYLYYKYKYQYSQLTPNDVNYYLSIENKMATFPVYYWILYDVASKSDENEYSNLIFMLEKILLLDKSLYTKKARIELGKLDGFSEEESEFFLIPQEVQFLLESYITSENERELESIYKFVSLKDSTYIYRALSILKEYASKNQLIKKVLSDCYVSGFSK